MKIILDIPVVRRTTAKTKEQLLKNLMPEDVFSVREGTEGTFHFTKKQDPKGVYVYHAEKRRHRKGDTDGSGRHGNYWIGRLFRFDADILTYIDQKPRHFVFMTRDL